MKRFFFVFSIIMIVFLVLTAGCFAALAYGSIQTYNRAPVFFAGWGITEISFSGKRVVYPDGDIFLIRQVPAQDIDQADMILFYVTGMTGIISGYVTNADDGTIRVEAANHTEMQVPPADVVGRYEGRIPGLGKALGMLRSPFAIGVFALVLVASIILWRRLPAKKGNSDDLGPSDGEIASILY